MKICLPLFGFLLLALGACRPGSGPEVGQSSAPAPVTTAAGTGAVDAPETFTDRVWRVERSSAVALGTRYTFLADGTLVVQSESGTPGYGTWRFESRALTMVEDGIAYATDILQLDAQAFVIRHNTPGGPVTIALVAAPGEPLPVVVANE